MLISNRLEEIKQRWAGLEGTRSDVVYLLRCLEAAEALAEELAEMRNQFLSDEHLTGWVKRMRDSVDKVLAAWLASKEEPDAYRRAEDMP